MSFPLTYRLLAISAAMFLAISGSVNMALAAPPKGAATTGGKTISHTPPPPKEGVVVEMEQYIVRGDRVLPPPESWRYVRVPAMGFSKDGKIVTTPEFEILSNLSKRNTKAFVIELQRQQLAGALLWPQITTMAQGMTPLVLLDNTKIDVLDGTAAPVQWVPLILDNEEDAHLETTEDYDTSYQRYTQLLTGHGIIGVRTAVNSNMPLDRLASHVSQRIVNKIFNDHAYSTARWFRQGLSRLLASVEVSATEIVFGVQPREQAYSTAYSRGFGGNPFGSTSSRIDGDFARASMRSSAPLERQLYSAQAASGYTSSPGYFGDAFGRSGPVPIGIIDRESVGSLKKLLENDSNNEGRPMDTSLANNFVSFALYADQCKYAAGFCRFVEKAGKEPVDETFFKECFGMSYKQMEETMSNALNGMSVTRTHHLRGKFHPLLPFEIRAATQAEIGRIQGTFFYLENKPARALEAMRLAYWRGERAPELLAALADMEQRHGSPERCEKILTALFKLPEPPARARVTQVRRTCMDTINKLPSGGLLEVADTSALLSEIGKVMGKTSPSEDLCEVFAEVVLRSKGTPEERIVAFLKKVSRLFPHNAKIREASKHLTLLTASLPEIQSSS